MNEKLRAFVKEKFIYHKDRYLHTCGVEEVAIELARIYDISLEKASITALTHDMLKYDPVLDQIKYLDEETISKFKDIPVMYHAYAAAAYIKKELNITDQEIIDAVKYHVWGRSHMTTLEKILYVADFAEPNRAFHEAKKIREIAKKDLDLALVLAMKSSIDYLIEKGIKPSIEQYEAFHYYEEVTRGKIK